MRQRRASAKVEARFFSRSQRTGTTIKLLMKNLGWKQWLVLIAFLLVLLFTGFFAVRTVQRAVYWRHHRDERIRPWMNVGYIAHSHRVPPRILYEALGLPPKPDKRPIREIARSQNRSVQEIIDVLEQTIANARLNDSHGAGPPDRERSP
jgi:ribosomal protein L22